MLYEQHIPKQTSHNLIKMRDITFCILHSDTARTMHRAYLNRHHTIVLWWETSPSALSTDRAYGQKTSHNLIKMRDITFCILHSDTARTMHRAYLNKHHIILLWSETSPSALSTDRAYGQNISKQTSHNIIVIRAILLCISNDTAYKQTSNNIIARIYISFCIRNWVIICIAHS